MMNGDGWTDNPSAVLASAIVSCRSQSTRDKPALAAIGSWATTVQGIAFPDQKCIPTCCTAKPITGLGFILSHHPRLALKRFAAVITEKTDRINPCKAIPAGYLLMGKPVDRFATFVDLVAFLESVAHVRSLCLMPLATTGKTTKTGGLGSIWFHGKRMAAD